MSVDGNSALQLFIFDFAEFVPEKETRLNSNVSHHLHPLSAQSLDTTLYSSCLSVILQHPCTLDRSHSHLLDNYHLPLLIHSSDRI